MESGSGTGAAFFVLELGLPDQLQLILYAFRKAFGQQGGAGLGQLGTGDHDLHLSVVVPFGADAQLLEEGLVVGPAGLFVVAGLDVQPPAGLVS